MDERSVAEEELKKILSHNPRVPWQDGTTKPYKLDLYSLIIDAMVNVDTVTLTGPTDSKLYSKVCGLPSIRMLGETIINGQRIPALTGEYKNSNIVQLADRFAANNPDLLAPMEVLKLYSDEYNFSSNDQIIPTIKQRFRECTRPYLNIPLQLLFNDIEGKSNKPQAHQNSLILSKKGFIIHIEPTQSDLISQSEYDEDIKSSILKFVNDEIGLKDPTLIEINETCPQAVTQDKNCMFWTMFIVYSILKQADKDPNVVIKEQFSKPREELVSMISKFKSNLVHVIIPRMLLNNQINWEDWNKFYSKYGHVYSGGKRVRVKTKLTRRNKRKLTKKMDGPKTRRESKKSKKEKKGEPFGKKHVRAVESLTTKTKSK